MKLLMIALLTAVPAPRQEAGNAQALLKDALAKAKESKKKVLLTFGGPGCGWCVRFEAWKARAEVAPLLDKEFVLLYVDTTKIPGGAELQQSYPKARQGGIPWFVIHDADRAELADSNGPQGNIGCPNTDEEIDVFMGILKKVNTTLKEDDLAALKKSLVAHREKK